MTKTIRASKVEVVSRVFGASRIYRQVGQSGVEAIWHRSADLAGGRAYRAGLAVAGRWRRSCWSDLALVVSVPGTAGSLVGAGL